MTGNGNDSPHFSTAESWLNWRFGRPAVRWLAIALASGSTLVGALACYLPGKTKIWPFSLCVTNPLKAFFVALVALQVWSLATPQIHAAARRYLGASVWRLAFFVWGTLFGLAAIIGIVRINLNCQAVPPSLLPDPAWASAISFILLAPTFTTRDPRPALRAFLERLIAQWISWNWRARMVLLAFCLNILPLVYSVGTYWKRASQQYYLHNPAMPVWQLADGTCSNLDHFCQQCRAQIPPNANILYHGPNDGLVMAYELYPRRLYMLPYEQRNLCEYCWCLEKWCRGMAPDPLDIVWKWDPPIPDVPEDQFVREHHITYVVNYDYFNPANTSILPLQ